MVKDYAWIEAGRVVNVAVWDQQPPAGWVELTPGAGIGWGWDGAAFVAPQAPQQEPAGTTEAN